MTHWTIDYIGTLPWNYVVEQLTYWAAYPPPHILMRRVAMAFGFKMASTAREKTVLSDFENDLLNGVPVKGMGAVPVKGWGNIPASVQSSLTEILAQHTQKAVTDGSSN